MSHWQPPADAAKQHIFAVIRLDFWDDEKIEIPRDDALWGGQTDAGPNPACISGTKAYTTLEAAGTEARRLNTLNKHTGARYFVTLVRLVTEQPNEGV